MKSKLYAIAVVVTLLSVVPASAQQTVTTNDYGYTGFESNELTVGSVGASVNLLTDKLIAGRFELDLQAVDGNIVLYNQQCDGGYRAVWTMATGFHSPPYTTSCP